MFGDFAGTSELQRESFSTHLSRIPPGPFYSDHSKGEEISGWRPTDDSMHNRAVYAAKPYAARADEIGPYHHVPEISHLDGLSKPDGRKQGDQPIDPQAAQRLFQVAREEPQKTLMTNFDEMEHQGQENCADRDRNWKEHQLDHTLYIERVNVYHRYQQDQQSEPQLGYDERQDSSQSKSFNPPRPINPPATTSYSLTANPPPYPVLENGHREPSRVCASHPAQNQPRKSIRTLRTWRAANNVARR